jgi:hypothetical protein
MPAAAVTNRAARRQPPALFSLPSCREGRGKGAAAPTGKKEIFFFEKKVTVQIGSNVQRRAWQAAESGSFLKKRTKKLCEFGFGLSWKTEAE